MWGRTLAVFNKMRISQDCLGALRETWWDYKDSSICRPWKIKRLPRPKFGRSYPRGRRATFTWTQTRRYVALCCPVGSAAAFCICLGPLSCSRRVARHSASSLFRLGPEPTRTLMSERSKRRKDERATDREEEEKCTTGVEKKKRKKKGKKNNAGSIRGKYG